MSENEQLNLVLIGKTGTGKSSSCNTLLGTEDFRVDGSSVSCTQKCQEKTGRIAGFPVKLIDTPGNYDTRLDFSVEDMAARNIDKYKKFKEMNEQITAEIGEAVSMSADGVDTFFITCRHDVRFTQEERDALNQFFQVFGDVENFVILVVTHGDDLRRGVARQLGVDPNIRDPIERMYAAGHKWIEKASKSDPFLSELLQKIGHRFVVLDNELALEDEEMRERMTQRVMEAVEEQRKSHNYKKYHNTVFKSAQIAYKKIQAQKDQLIREQIQVHETLMKQREALEKSEKERQKMMQEFQIKMQKAEENQKEMVRDLQARSEAQARQHQDGMNKMVQEFQDKMSAAEQKNREMNEKMAGKQEKLLTQMNKQHEDEKKEMLRRHEESLRAAEEREAQRLQEQRAQQDNMMQQMNVMREEERELREKQMQQNAEQQEKMMQLEKENAAKEREVLKAQLRAQQEAARAAQAEAQSRSSDDDGWCAIL